MVAITTLITPVWLKKAYSKEPPVANYDSREAIWFNFYRYFQNIKLNTRL